MNTYVYVSDHLLFTLDAAFWLGMGVIEHGIRNGIQHPLPPWAPRRRRWPKAVRAAPSARAPRHGIRNGIPNGIPNYNAWTHGIPNGIPNCIPIGIPTGWKLRHSLRAATTNIHAAILGFLIVFWQIRDQKFGIPFRIAFRLTHSDTAWNTSIVIWDTIWATISDTIWDTISDTMPRGPGGGAARAALGHPGGGGRSRRGVRGGEGGGGGREVGRIDWVGIGIGKGKRKGRRQSPNRLYKAPAKTVQTKPQQIMKSPKRLYKLPSDYTKP